ncbi:DUF397 domain-containing protein [Kitasatospora sp. NPDC098663]|uniref:DUF397 domain-containing protein n=1 Tax=Kitasatospora sp. NPDC098663 TaxID=3364096 RepID=UPI003829F63D
MSSELIWFKSSHSGNEGGACIEIAWFKSSYSGNECVEVAETTEAVLVRDSKDASGPHHTFTPAAWQAFVAFAATSEA